MIDCRVFIGRLLKVSYN